MSPYQIPDTHFVDSEDRHHPLVVRHATGQPEYAIVDGRCVPIDEYRLPATARPPQGPLTLRADGAGASFGLSVT